MRNNIGIWAPACVQHGFEAFESLNSPKYEVPTSSGKTLLEAMKEFLDSPERGQSHIDGVKWPDNGGCSGIKRTIQSIGQEIFQM